MGVSCDRDGESELTGAPFPTPGLKPAGRGRVPVTRRHPEGDSPSSQVATSSRVGHVAGPEMLLLDEPTSSLDPGSTESVENLMRQLTPALTLIVVTHNLGQARRVSQSTILFYDGRLIEHGATSELFDAPRDPRTQRYVNGLMG